MKQSKLTFNSFRGLDFRTTKESVAFTGKPNDVGFEEFQALIKEWVAHPLPNFQSIGSSSWKLFQVWGDMYLMETSGIKKRNGSSFSSFISATMSNNPDYRDIKPFFELTLPGTTLGAPSEVGDQWLRYTAPMARNIHVGKHIAIQSSSTLQALYITWNDENTIFVDWLINWEIINSGIINSHVYPKQDILVVNDWATIKRYIKSTWALLGTVKTISNAFIEIFANRLFIMGGNQIEFTTFLSATLFNQNNFIDTEWKIVDTTLMWNSMVVFTTSGTFAVTGTWYTSMNFPKISEFSPYGRVYPVSHIDNIYISYEGYIRRFTNEGVLQTQYNYNLIPDTQAKIFQIERWVIFSLGHSSSKYGILNVEELQNRRLITMTNFRDANITSILEFNGVIYMVAGGTLYKEKWQRNIKIKTNKIRANKKLYRDMVDMATAGDYPASINVTWDWATKTSTKNTYANQTSYNIKEKSFDMQIEIETTDTISSFNIYYIL